MGYGLKMWIGYKIFPTSSAAWWILMDYWCTDSELSAWGLQDYLAFFSSQTRESSLLLGHTLIVASVVACRHRNFKCQTSLQNVLVFASGVVPKCLERMMRSSVLTCWCLNVYRCVGSSQECQDDAVCVGHVLSSAAWLSAAALKVPVWMVITFVAMMKASHFILIDPVDLSRMSLQNYCNGMQSWTRQTSRKVWMILNIIESMGLAGSAICKLCRQIHAAVVECDPKRYGGKWSSKQSALMRIACISIGVAGLLFFCFNHLPLKKHESSPFPPVNVPDARRVWPLVDISWHLKRNGTRYTTVGWSRLRKILQWGLGPDLSWTKLGESSNQATIRHKMTQMITTIEAVCPGHFGSHERSCPNFAVTWLF